MCVPGRAIGRPAANNIVDADADIAGEHARETAHRDDDQRDDDCHDPLDLAKPDVAAVQCRGELVGGVASSGGVAA